MYINGFPRIRPMRGIWWGRERKLFPTTTRDCSVLPVMSKLLICENFHRKEEKQYLCVGYSEGRSLITREHQLTPPRRNSSVLIAIVKYSCRNFHRKYTCMNIIEWKKIPVRGIWRGPQSRRARAPASPPLETTVRSYQQYKSICAVMLKQFVVIVSVDIYM